MATKINAESLPRVAALHVGTPQGYAGILSKGGQYSFTYDAGVVLNQDPSTAISLSMAVRPESYSTTPLLPVFQTSLPEGYLLDRIRSRFAKVVRMDDMALLALSGSNRIGRLVIRQHKEDLNHEQPSANLSEILADEGSRNLFEELSDRYLITSGIAGVQPKVVVSAADDASSGTNSPFDGETATKSLPLHASLRTRDVIVKVGADEYPGLSENEYFCLEIARRCALDVPKTWLSADSKRLVIERFDIERATGTALGFEDMVSVTGQVNDRKYEGSYEVIARAIGDYCSPVEKKNSLLALFKAVTLSVILRNGDGHLKNFGLLYTDPSSDDVRLSPIYDLVCTTVYLGNDRLALSLGKSRDWPRRKTLIDFGTRNCDVRNADVLVEEILTVALEYRPEVDRTGIWQHMHQEISKAALSLLPLGTSVPENYRSKGALKPTPQ